MADATRLWQQHFPSLAGATDAAMRRLIDNAEVVTLPAGQHVFYPGAPCSRYLLLTAGRIKVELTGESGRQVLLYRVGPGESCILTTACLLGSAPYPADGIVEEQATALAVRLTDFEAALRESTTFRQYVFSSLGRRFSDVVGRMEHVAFDTISARLAHTLLHHYRPGHAVKLTHQDIAAEMGSAREVVSRHLKQFESRGWVRLGRGLIEISQPDALQRLDGQAGEGRGK